MPFLAALGLLLIALKLTGYIVISWWLVTLPIWAPLAVFLALFAGVAIVGALIATTAAKS